MQFHTCVNVCDLCTSLYAPVLKLMSYYPLAGLCIFHGVLGAEAVQGGVVFFFPSMAKSLFWQLVLSHGAMTDAVVCDQKMVSYMHILKFWLPSLHRFLRVEFLSIVSHSF